MYWIWESIFKLSWNNTPINLTQCSCSISSRAGGIWKCIFLWCILFCSGAASNFRTQAIVQPATCLLKCTRHLQRSIQLYWRSIPSTYNNENLVELLTSRSHWLHWPIPIPADAVYRCSDIFTKDFYDANDAKFLKIPCIDWFVCTESLNYSWVFTARPHCLQCRAL